MHNKIKTTVCIILLITSPLSLSDTLTELTETYSSDATLIDKDSAPSKFHGLLGGIAVNTDKYVGEEERKTYLLPLLILTYANTIEWHVGGGTAWLYTSDNRAARLGLALRSRGAVRTEDDDVLDGMEERDRSFEIGLNSLWRISKLKLKAAVFQEVSGKHDGESAVARVFYPIRLNKQWGVTPSITIEWLSKDLVDYYYGVRATESTPSRPSYSGRSATNARVGFSTSYRFQPRWLFLGGISYGVLGNGLTESPIVNRDDVISLNAGVGWIF